MAGCNDSAPERRHGKVRSGMHWLNAAASPAGGWGQLSIHGSRALKRRGAFVFLRRYTLLLFGGFLLLLAWYIPRHFPEWYLHVTAFFLVNLLFVGTVLFVLLFLLLWKVPQWQVEAITDAKGRLTAESGFRQTLAQIVGGAVLLVGLYFTAQTLQVSREGQITDRFTKAIAQLGQKDNLAVRLGGIYALERIARDSEPDHCAVIEVLTAFVREQTHVQKTTPIEPLKANIESQGLERSKVPTDIQAILTVLGRRTRTYGKGESQPLNLSGSQLQKANLAGVNLQKANLAGVNLQEATLATANLQEATLVGANLQEADLATANLQKADLRRANLRKAGLIDANLQKAGLWRANLQEANLAGANLQEADLMSANLQEAFLGFGTNLQEATLAGANLQEAFLGSTTNLQKANLAGANLQRVDLTGARNLTQDQINVACVSEHTRLPEGLTKPAPCPPPQP